MKMNILHQVARKKWELRNFMWQCQKIKGRFFYVDVIWFKVRVNERSMDLGTLIDDSCMSIFCSLTWLYQTLLPVLEICARSTTFAQYVSLIRLVNHFTNLTFGGYVRIKSICSIIWPNSAPLRDISLRNLSDIDIDIDLSMSLRSNVLASTVFPHMLSY